MIDRIDVNILIGHWRPEDIPMFFGDNSGVVPDTDVFLNGTLSEKWPELLANLGVFRSRSDARRNGWNKPIANGWSDVVIGKPKHRICVLKVVP